jgi:hypothetical protein
MHREFIQAHQLRLTNSTSHVFIQSMAHLLRVVVSFNYVEVLL